MEVLSNLVWLAVAIALWGLWFANLRGARKKSLLPAIGVQVMALAMLTGILLPVISVTDDLQASHMPAEVERTSARSDRHLSPALPTKLPFALAVLTSWLSSRHPRRVALLAREESVQRQKHGHLIPLWSRPPPTA